MRGVRFVRVAALLIVCLGATATPPAILLWRQRQRTRIARLRTAARITLMSPDPGRALPILEQALLLEPDDAEVNAEHGAALLRLGERGRARESFERACALDTDVIIPRLQLAIMATQERKADRARELLEWLQSGQRSARVRPYAATLELLAGEIARFEGDAAAASAHANRALAIHSELVPAMLLRATIAHYRSEASLAREQLERDVLAVPEAPVLIALSRAREATGDRAGALAALDRIEAPEHEVDAAVRRAELFARAGAVREVAVLAAALTARGDAGSAAAYVAGLVHRATGDHASAEAAFREATDVAPFFFQARLALARTLIERDRLAVARATLHALVDDDPLFPGARVTLAEVALRADDLEGAASAATEILASAPRHLEAVRILVAARTRQGRPGEAAETLAALEREDPSNVIAAFGRSMAWLAAVEEASVEPEARHEAASTTVRSGLETLARGMATRRAISGTLDRLGSLDAPELRGGLVRTYSELGEAGRALALAGDAPVASSSLDWPVHAELARRAGDLDRAATFALAYLDAHPGDLAGLLVLARIHLAAGRPDAALRVASEATDAIGATGSTLLIGASRRDAIDLHRVTLAAAVDAGDLQRARIADAAARQLDPSISPAALVAGALAIGRDDVAAEALAPILARDPEARADPDVRWLAGVLALVGDDERAAVRVEGLASPGSIARTLLLVDALLVGRGDRARAGAAASSFRARARSTPRVRAIGRALARHALETPLPEAAAIAAPVHRMLVAIAWGFRRPALHHAEALSRRPGGLPVVVELLAAHGLESLGLDRHAGAMLEAAVARRPRSLGLLEALGARLIDAGEHEQAAALLERAVAEAPADPWYRVIGFLDRAWPERGAPAATAFRESVLPGSTRPRRGTGASWQLRQARALEALGRALRPPEHPELAAAAGDPDPHGLREHLRGRMARVLAALARTRDEARQEQTVRLQLGLTYARQGRGRDALAELDETIRLDRENAIGLRAAREREAILVAIAGEGGRPGATPETARALVEGEEILETLGPPESVHTHRLDHDAERAVEVIYRGPEDSPSALNLLAAEDGARRKTADVPAGGSIRWRLQLEAGTHTVEIHGAERSSIAPYRLTVGVAIDDDDGPVDIEPNDLLADARPLFLDGGVRSRVGPGPDRDIWRLPGGDEDGAAVADLWIEAPAEVELRARLVEGEEEADAVKTLRVAPGARVRVPGVRLDAARWLSIESMADGEGAYLIELAAAADRERVLSEPDDRPGDATRIALAEDGVAVEWEGTLEPAGDVDAARLPMRCSLELHAPPGVSVRVTLVEADVLARAVRTLTIAPGGRLRIDAVDHPALVATIEAIDGAAGDAPYRLILGPPIDGPDREPNDTLRSAARLRPGTTAGRLDAAEDRDVYLVDDAGGAPILRLTALDGPVRLGLVTATAGQTRVTRTVEATPGAPVDLEDPEAGLVAVQLAGDTGSRYELVLERR